MPNSKIVACALLAMLTCTTPLLAQDTSRSTADSLRLAGSLEAATAAYREAVHRHPEDGDNVYLLASTFALQPNLLDSAFYYLNLELAGDSTMKPLWDADLFFMADNDRWPSVEETQLSKLAATVSGEFDRDYARQLFRIRMREHAYRYHIMLAMRELGPSNPVVSALAIVMGEHHNDNLIKLEQLIRERGWPVFSRVGEDAAYAAGNVVNHSDLETRQRYLPMLKDVCERGEGDWSRYAHIFDRTELELGRKQVYGTQMELNEDLGRFEPQPLLDPENVDERRAKLGLEPLADQLKRFNEHVLRDFGISKKN